MAIGIGRREFIAALGGVAVAWPCGARGQPALPVVGVLNSGAADYNVAAFRKGLHENGTIDGQNVTVEYYGLDGQFDRLSAMMADLVRRQVAVIVTTGPVQVARAAKDATATIPIVFSVAQDPVRLGLVASLARPGGNATGINFSPPRWWPSGYGSCMTWCPRPFVLPCSSIRPTLRAPRTPCGKCSKPPPLSGCKFRASTPVRSARSMWPLPPLRASAPMLSSSPPTGSLTAASCNLPHWRR